MVVGVQGVGGGGGGGVLMLEEEQVKIIDNEIIWLNYVVGTRI